MNIIQTVPTGHNGEFLRPDFENIPKDLVEWPHWVAWSAQADGSKVKKVPINPYTGTFASATTPSTWGSFSQAVECYRRRHLTGVGVVLGSAIRAKGSSRGRASADSTSTTAAMAKQARSMKPSATR